MKNANQVCSAVNAAIDDEKPVYFTDGCISARIYHAKISSQGIKGGTLDLTTGLPGYDSVVSIEVIWPFDELSGFELANIDGELYIGPDWFVND